MRLSVFAAPSVAPIAPSRLAISRSASLRIAPVQRRTGEVGILQLRVRQLEARELRFTQVAALALQCAFQSLDMFRIG